MGLLEVFWTNSNWTGTTHLTPPPCHPPWFERKPLHKGLGVNSRFYGIEKSCTVSRRNGLDDIQVTNSWPTRIQNCLQVCKHNIPGRSPVESPFHLASCAKSHVVYEAKTDICKAYSYKLSPWCISNDTAKMYKMPEPKDTVIRPYKQVCPPLSK